MYQYVINENRPLDVRLMNAYFGHIIYHAIFIETYILFL
ncbi:hypothetical protein Bache_2606 [Bacteroides helcogenes P 36-108]|uniref:Uncharacterized protein n=1 Tax=Bacteroides helcogenes (strain ATCC 35417 / DSM 20613 / JCM 6297 / CCUG 15421 / P 36-108) TaxID=693979 RepID=E6SVX3_BACT6|nr:hypothetical protein Bache_2606 [Bacteroides helcogenes P 36-108]